MREQCELSKLLKMRGKSLNKNNKITWDIDGDISLVDRVTLLDTLRLIELEYNRLSLNNDTINIEIISSYNKMTTTGKLVYRHTDFAIGILNNKYYITIRCGCINEDYSISLVKALGIILAYQVMEVDSKYKYNNIVFKMVSLYYSIRLVDSYSKAIEGQLIETTLNNANDIEKHIFYIVSNILCGYTCEKADEYSYYNNLNYNIKGIITTLNACNKLDTKKVNGLRTLIHTAIRFR